MCDAFPDSKVVVLDKMTYAADVNYLLPLIASGRIELVVGDVCDFDLCQRVISDCDLVVHAAAESHVDRSFHSSIMFTQTNALGTHTILEACRIVGVPRIIHVSTDEVYGEVLGERCDETGILNPTNPYSASKAAAEMIVNGYRHSFKLPIIIIRANNVFGIRQFPEKLIPHSIMSLIAGRKISLHGDGRNVRHYLAASDLADALVLLAKKGVINEVYNVGSPDEFANHDVARMICDEFKLTFEDNVEFVSDRPFNDRRYAISWAKLTGLGWKPRFHLPDQIGEIVAWYKRNSNHILTKMEQIPSNGK